MLHAAKTARQHDVLAQIPEEALHQIKPGGGGWREMQVKARTFGQPRFDFGMFMGGVVVQDEMHIHPSRRLRVDLLEKVQPLLVAMARSPLRNHLAVQIIQGRKERDRAMPVRVMSVRANRSLLEARRLQPGPCASTAPAREQWTRVLPGTL